MSDREKSIGIGLMGIGVIGGGVAEVLMSKDEYLASQVGSILTLKKILEKDTARHGSRGIHASIFTIDYKDVLNDENIDIVIELMGGEHPAFEFITAMLDAGKHVVTANKEVMAKHGFELLTTARKNNVSLRYEASVGGGIPLIAPFQRDLAANDILGIRAIVNGTTNYILTRMSNEGLDFATALKQAQELGYAEADPTNDISGLDVAYKLAVLTSIAFDTSVDFSNIYYEGIAKIQACDFRYARELGYDIKLLAIARRVNNSIEARVHPVFIPWESLLAKVEGVYNAIEVEGDLVGKVIFYGQGAGPKATSSAVIADVINIARNVSSGTTDAFELPDRKDRIIKPVAEIETQYYFRMSVFDQPGVLAQISKVLGDHAISISSVIQKESNPEDKTAEIVIMTHPAQEQAVQNAMSQTEQLAVVKEISNFVRVED